MPKGRKEEGKTGSPAGQVILVVDDDPYITEVLVYTLRREGHAVETASDGRQALDMIRVRRPWLIFLDIGLGGGKTGVEVCQIVKADPALAGIYIIMLTGRGLEDDQTLAQGAGADVYLTKPFSPRAIAAQVKTFAQARDARDTKSASRGR